MILSSLGNYKNTALLLMRIGLGIMYILHGYPKIIGGVSRWESLGNNMAYLGIDFFPVAWGLLAALSEFAGAILLILGVAFRPACFFLLCTMTIASLSHIYKGQGIMEAAHAIKMGVVFLGLMFIGPGKYSIDKK